MSRSPSHITPKNRGWVLRRRLRDATGTACRLAGEGLRAVRYWLLHPAEARRTRGHLFLVYTMGKVASMSVYHGITRRMPHARAFAMHYMMPASLQRQEEILKDSMYRTMHTDHARRIRSCLDRPATGRVYVVTLVREPVARAVSDLFQHLSLYREEVGANMFPLEKITLHYPEQWIREELLALTGIDLQEQPFDPAAGYAICRKGRFDLLVVRYEDLNRVFGTAMEELTGVKGWRTGERNRSSGKGYGKAYEQFRDKLVLSEEVLEEVYSSEYAAHFYTAAEIQQFRVKWGPRGNEDANRGGAET